jgi:hypothetical protein
MVFGLIFVPTLDKEERNQSKKSLKKLIYQQNINFLH